MNTSDTDGSLVKVHIDTQAIHQAVSKALEAAGKSSGKFEITDSDEDAGDVKVESQNGHKTVTIHQSKSGSNGGDFEVVPIVAIVFVFIWLIIKAIMAPFTQRAARQSMSAPATDRLSEEEQAVLLKLQRTLTQMESRVESLETILIDQARTQQKYGSKL